MKTIIKYSLLSFFGLVLLCIHSATAQEQSLRFERITIEDGLPNPSVINIIQDRQGFMWFGTVSGVVRYDGYEMKIYYPAAVPQDSLPERDLPRLYQDKAGNIWVTLQYQQAKIFRYDTQTDQFLPIAFDPGAENREWFVPSTLFEDKLGRLLLGSWDHGLFVIDVAKEEDGTALSDFPFKVFKHNPNVPRSIPNNAILKMTEDGDGNIWIATEGGLCRFTPGVDTFETFLFAGDRPGLSEFCQDVFYEAPHTLWVGSDQHGLLKFDLETEEFVKQYQHDAGKPYSIAHHKVLKITKVRDGKFWIGTYGFLDIFDPEKETFTHISDNNSETWRTNFRWNNALITDYSGNIWAATWQKGIYKFNFDKGQFHFYEPSFFQKEIKAANSLWMYVEDHQSNLWLSDVYQNLIQWNPRTGQKHFYQIPQRNPSQNDDEPPGVYVGKNGSVWTFSKGKLGRIEPASGGVKMIDPDIGVIREVFSTSKENIWAMTQDNQLCLMTDDQSGAFKCYGKNSGLSKSDANWIYAICTVAEDPLGRVWFGTIQKGMYRLELLTGKVVPRCIHKSQKWRTFFQQPQWYFTVSSGQRKVRQHAAKTGTNGTPAIQ